MTDVNRLSSSAAPDSLAVVFMGSPAFSVPSLKRLADRYRLKAVYTQPPRKSGRGMKLKMTDVGTAAEEMGLPCFWPETLKQTTTQDQLASFQADVFVVVAYGLLLPQTVLNIPRYGCVNGHASLLPRWRGAAPIHRAIEAGDNITGISTMLMQKGLDTGPVFDTSQTEITADMTTGELHDILAEQTAETLCITLDKIACAEAQPIPQQEEGVVYAHKISSEDARLDLSCPAEQLKRKINAYNPYPGAFVETVFGRLKILRAQAIEMTEKDVPTGCFAGLSARGGLILSCGGQTALDIELLQPAGKPAMPARAWLNGHNLSPGQSLTNKI